ncbi:hypothetical protein Moror_17246 [Moniliophthora roreri MCA 2997]|uniref:Uncharacterized protein n=1 Tax=Moniliophthora roreri (strain MCA 2997) TaxID=1381753 RepID=V2XVN1_MONRO|nr:hypothetical protein Moror_17246 [Moniliophthora roreri MCA 2997]
MVKTYLESGVSADLPSYKTSRLLQLDVSQSTQFHSTHTKPNKTPPSLNQMHPVTQAIWTVVLIASGEHDRHPTHQWANLPDDEKADGTDVFKRKQ